MEQNTEKLSKITNYFRPKAPKYKINMKDSPHFTDKIIEPKFIVLHCIGYHDPVAILEQYSVSAHFLIPKQTKHYLEVYQLVQENKRAWHAGVSNWKEYQGLNDHAIGIEISMPNYATAVSKKEDEELNFKYFESFEPKQIAALIELVKDLQKQFNIPAENVIAHSDIAPYRIIDDKTVLSKTDPGPTLPWRQLAEHGIGVWPADEFDGELEGIELTAKLAQELLRKVGYHLPDTSEYDKATLLTLNAFRTLHFNEDHVSGVVPELNELDEKTYKMLYNLSVGCYLPVQDTGHKAEIKTK